MILSREQLVTVLMDNIWKFDESMTLFTLHRSSLYMYWVLHTLCRHLPEKAV